MTEKHRIEIMYSIVRIKKELDGITELINNDLKNQIIPYITVIYQLLSLTTEFMIDSPLLIEKSEQAAIRIKQAADLMKFLSSEEIIELNKNFENIDKILKTK